MSAIEEAGAEMPKYRTSKTVWALKIAAIESSPATDGAARITPAEAGYAPFEVDAAYMRKHTPQVGGYYVVYRDGYKSFSPSDAFEESATRI